MAGWAGHSIVKVDLRGDSPPVSIHVDFLPDNVRSDGNGSFIVAGQIATVAESFACHASKDRPKYCSSRWAAVALDNSMQVQHRWQGDGGAVFGSVSVALRVDHHMWLGSSLGDRVAIVKE